jgi:Asp-tRNA(Asn)/Glu-tRNA(Gln) amidotransferase A subunit family amidase
MQIMGNSLKEESLLQAAYALESKTELPEVPL